MLRLAFLALALVAGCRAEDASVLPEEPMKGILDITPQNIDKVLNGAKPGFVEFFAPWCGHCKAMAPEFVKLGELMDANPELKDKIVVGKLDADKYPKLGRRLHVAGYPTLRFFPRGKVPGLTGSKDYSGERTADAIFAYLKRKLEAQHDVARVEALDTVAAKLGKAAEKDAKKLVAELEAAAAKLEGDAKAHGEAYVKLAKKGAEKGKAWYATERARLERMIASGSVSIDKLEGMVARSSALGAFLGNKVVAPAGGDKDEEAPDATEPYVEEEEDEEEDEEEEDEEDEDEAGSEEL